MKTKATLTAVRARVKCVLIYSNIENATICLLPWIQVANFLFFVCVSVPQLYLWGSPLLGEIFAYVPVF